MKLDDRPVIDQLLNPTPLNIVRDVEREVCDRASDAEAFLYDPLREQLRDYLKLPRENLNMALRAAQEALDVDMADTLTDAIQLMNDSILDWAEMAAADETDRTVAHLRHFASELEAQL